MHEYTGGKKRLLSLAAEQELARELIENYKQRMSGDGKGRYGANKIVEDIYSVVGRKATDTLNGDDLKHWLEGRTNRLGDSKFQPIKEFIVSPEFGEVVHEAKQQFDSLGRTIEIGCSFAQAHGYDLSSNDYKNRLGLNGVWMLSQDFTEDLWAEAKPIDDLGRMSGMMALLDYAQTVGWFAQIRSITGYGFSIVHFLEVDGQPTDLRPAFRAPAETCVKSSGFLFQESRQPIDGLIWNRTRQDEYRCNLSPSLRTDSAFILQPTDGFKGFINPTNKPLLAFKLSKFFEILIRYQPIDMTGDATKYIETIRDRILKDRLNIEKTIGEIFDTLGFDVISQR